MSAYEVVVDALRANGCNVIEKGGGRAQSQCPAHDDRNPSLSIGPREAGDGVVLHCHACGPSATPDILAAIGLSVRDLFDEPRMRAAYSDRNTYIYPDGRRVHRKPGKRFHQSGNTRGTALFHADRIGDAALVYVPEGEKDVEAIEAAGGTAVCPPQGASTDPARFDWTVLRGLTVVVVADRDDKGRDHSRAVVKVLDGIALRVDVVQAAAGKDAADHIAAGMALHELVPVELDAADRADQVGAVDYDDDFWSEPSAPEPGHSDWHPVNPLIRRSGPLAHDDRHVIDGESFIFGDDDDGPALWGKGQEVLWAAGEALMIAGPQGVGKTSLAVQLVGALLFGGDLLGLPVESEARRVLYLAMDRPRQIRRQFRRHFRYYTDADRAAARDRLVIRKGPPVADMAANSTLLSDIAAQLEVDIVIVDSIKDAAIGLSKDEVAAAYNRARQHLLAAGRELCELHHPTKASGKDAPAGIADVFGSTWLTSGCGSVILLWGEPGDPIIEFRHLKTPAEQVPRCDLMRDEETGALTICDSTDPVALAVAAGPDGLTAPVFAAALTGKKTPTKGDVEKAKRALNKFVSKDDEGNDTGLLVRFDGAAGGADKRPSAWFPNLRRRP